MSLVLSGTDGIMGGVVSGDPTIPLGIVSKQFAESHGFTSGDVKMSFKSVADSGWILMNDLSIGSGTSSATGRANADTSDLYTVIWNSVSNVWAPVVGGRGASASADFATNKPMALPKALGRALAGYGTGTTVASGVDADVNTTTNTLTVPLNTNTWVTGMPVVLTFTSGSITGDSAITTSTTYWVIRVSSTSISLATTLANAQNLVAIDFVTKSSPVWSITYTFSSRLMGESCGEEAHAMSITELLSHGHNAGSNILNSPSAGGFFRTVDAAGSTLTGLKGGNVAMNIVQPTLFLNVFVKL